MTLSSEEYKHKAVYTITTEVKCLNIVNILLALMLPCPKWDYYDANDTNNKITITGYDFPVIKTDSIVID